MASGFDTLIDNSGFCNIIMYIGKGSKIFLERIYTNCTFIFNDLSKEEIYKFITVMNAVSCDFIMHDPAISMECDVEIVGDGKGMYKRYNCRFISIQDDKIKHYVKNVSKLRLETLTEE